MRMSMIVFLWALSTAFRCYASAREQDEHPET
jgi:hypothetical protein